MAAATKPHSSPRGWYFHSEDARAALAAARQGEKRVDLSLNLNLSRGTWEIRDTDLVLSEDTGLPLDLLEPVARSENRIFFFDGRRFDPLEIRADGYFKLVPTASAPTLEIDGVKMHRSKDIDPLEDARQKADLVVRPGDIVLDTCGGLGYSAIFAVRAGAETVFSWEKSRAVMALRGRNPWILPGAFPWLTKDAAGRVRLEHGDIVQRIPEVADQSCHAVIHDPPRFSSATGDLYGRAFYGQLARVLKPRGRLFHYTGTPGRIKGGTRFVDNAARRLEAAGFCSVSFNEGLQGLVAEKGQGSHNTENTGRPAGRRLIRGRR